MLGAIIGDICGSVYEWDNQRDENKVELFKKGCFPTDDSVMTVAMCRALLDAKDQNDDVIRDTLVTSMHYYGRLFPDAGYGNRFQHWLWDYDRKPYNSWGNGSGMRVASVGWLYDSLEETLHVAKLSAEVTHDHPEGIKGAQAIAAAIFLARTGHSKEEIRDYCRTFYALDFTLDEVRPTYEFKESCQDSCPHAIQAFLEGKDFEDVIKKAISVGGDSDTIAAMAGGIAEAFYGIPEETEKKAFEMLKTTKGRGWVYNNQLLADEVRRLRDYIKK